MQEKRRQKYRDAREKKFGLKALLSNPEKWCDDTEKEKQRHKDAYQKRKKDPAKFQILQRRKRAYNAKNRRANLSKEKKEEERRKSRERYARWVANTSKEEQRKKGKLKYERRKEKKRAANSLCDNPLIDYFGKPHSF